MMCLDASQIARAATLGESDPHLATCLDCRRRLAAERALCERVRAVPATEITMAQRRALGAEIMASAAMGTRQRKRWPIVAAAIVAAAACALPFLRPASVAATAIAAPSPTSDEAVAMRATAIAQADAAPPPVEARVLTLDDGTLTLDTRGTREIDLHVGSARIRVANASITVTARAHAITSVQVVIGSARIENGPQQVTVQRGATWTPSPTASQQAMATFRDGWIALRAGNYQEAIALFDRVTDPVAVEDAQFWAAIAARRSGDTQLAADRIKKFLERFPHSAYVDQISR